MSSAESATVERMVFFDCLSMVYLIGFCRDMGDERPKLSERRFAPIVCVHRSTLRPIDPSAGVARQRAATICFLLTPPPEGLFAVRKRILRGCLPYTRSCRSGDPALGRKSCKRRPGLADLRTHFSDFEREMSEKCRKSIGRIGKTSARRELDAPYRFRGVPSVGRRVVDLEREG